ncbi:MAG TPA: hypothetical protein VEJ18_02105, partial [Planctomycetota bacterium]|nr:hypothetical protein [Planctomycetota bacterium]
MASRLPFCCKTLSGITPPPGAVAYEVAPLRGGRPRWSPACPLPAREEIPYPALVRFVLASGGHRGCVRVDPGQPEAVDALVAPSRKAYLRAVWAAAKRRKGKVRGDTMSVSLRVVAADVAQELRQEVAALAARV